MQTHTEPLAGLSTEGDAAAPDSEGGLQARRKRLSKYAPAAMSGGIFAAAMALYLPTLAPSVLPGDYAEFQMCAAVLGVPHPTGYPLYVLLGKVFTLLPVGDVAYRVNLSSAIYMAGAAVLLFATTARLIMGTGRTCANISVALSQCPQRQEHDNRQHRKHEQRDGRADANL